ncbi:MAG TPA: class I SAM-dependent methyltransferase [Ktedonobacterales bacterium]|nr:class I SAM-dependent methyltransferase [Ktedonobacterales bacterium]
MSIIQNVDVAERIAYRVSRGESAEESAEERGCAVARWTRALRALPFRRGRVLDLGCAFGFATRMLTRAGYHAVGVDASPAYIARARRADPRGEYLLANASQTGLPSASFDGVIFLDVLEHLPDERGAIDEIARVLKPGGALAVSAPHRGLLWRLDSLNLYAALVRATRRGLFPPEIAATGIHRHYALDDLRALLGDRFEIRRVTRTGLGVAELLNLPLLVLLRWVIQWDTLYQIVAFAYYTVYLAEDVVPLGPLGYHLFVLAVRRDDGARS